MKSLAAIICIAAIPLAVAAGIALALAATVAVLAHDALDAARARRRKEPSC